MVEQLGGVPVLDAPVPQMVEHMVDALKIIARGLPEQVFEVPKITLQDRVPHRAASRLPQVAEQLVEVPVHSARDCVIKETLSPVVLARYTVARRGATALGRGGSTGGCGAHSTLSGDPRRESPPAQGGIQILGKAHSAQLWTSP